MSCSSAQDIPQPHRQACINRPGKSRAELRRMMIPAVLALIIFFALTCYPSFQSYVLRAESGDQGQTSTHRFIRQIEHVKIVASVITGSPDILSLRLRISNSGSVPVSYDIRLLKFSHDGKPYRYVPIQQYGPSVYDIGPMDEQYIGLFATDELLIEYPQTVGIYLGKLSIGGIEYELGETTWEILKEE